MEKTSGNVLKYLQPRPNWHKYLDQLCEHWGYVFSTELMFNEHSSALHASMLRLWPRPQENIRWNHACNCFTHLIKFLGSIFIVLICIWVKVMVVLQYITCNVMMGYYYTCKCESNLYLIVMIIWIICAYKIFIDCNHHIRLALLGKKDIIWNTHLELPSPKPFTDLRQFHQIWVTLKNCIKPANILHATYLIFFKSIFFFIFHFHEDVLGLREGKIFNYFKIGVN